MMQTCTKCQKEKDDSCFGKDSRKKSGLQSHCRDCQKAWKKKHYQKNTDRFRAEARERSAAREKTEDQIARKKEYDREYRRKNAKRLSQIKRKWRAENQNTVSAIRKSYKAKRRSLERGGVSTAELADWQSRAEKICHYCGCECEDDFHVDHYYPLSRGGKHELDNLVIACPSCNVKKNAMDPVEFIKKQSRFTCGIDVLRAQNAA